MLWGFYPQLGAAEQIKEHLDVLDPGGLDRA